jgi:hypothetical protein
MRAVAVALRDNGGGPLSVGKLVEITGLQERSVRRAIWTIKRDYPSTRITTGPLTISYRADQPIRKAKVSKSIRTQKPRTGRADERMHQSRPVEAPAKVPVAAPAPIPAPRPVATLASAVSSVMSPPKAPVAPLVATVLPAPKQQTKPMRGRDSFLSPEEKARKALEKARLAGGTEKAMEIAAKVFG